MCTDSSLPSRLVDSWWQFEHCFSLSPHSYSLHLECLSACSAQHPNNETKFPTTVNWLLSQYVAIHLVILIAVHRLPSNVEWYRTRRRWYHCWSSQWCSGDANRVPSTLDTVPTTSWSPVVCRWEGRLDPAMCTGKYSLGDNWEATCETARESVFDGWGNVQS